MVYKDNINKEPLADTNKNNIEPKEILEDDIEEKVENLLRALTLDDKLKEVRSSFSPQKPVGNYTRILGELPPAEAAKLANEVQSRAGAVPAIIHEECLHGVRAIGSTQFPQSIALASTWDPDLVYRVARAIAREARARGIRQCLSPVVDLARDVRAGRTEETYGEDPLLASKLAEAYCKALRDEGVVATPKHYIANFVGEGGRDSAEIHLSERILREVYLKPYMACIRAGALSVMAAYNSVDGVPCNANKWLLTEVLRWGLGFKGFTVSDYGALWGLIVKHDVASSPHEAAAKALEAGLDLEMPEIGIYGEPLKAALEKGLVSQKALDEAVRHILYAKYAIGLFEDPRADPQKAEEITGSEEHVRLAYEAALKSFVLLKNEGVLPLSGVKSIALIGPYAEELPLGGYSGKPKRVVTLAEGLRALGVDVRTVKACPEDLGREVALTYAYLYQPDDPSQRGVLVEIYGNPDFSGSPIFASRHKGTPGLALRLDWGHERPTCDWGCEPPYPADLPKLNYSVRVKAVLRPPEPGKYVVRLIAEGGSARLFIGGRLIIDCWDGGCPLSKEAVVELGESQYFLLEYRKVKPAYTYIAVGLDYAEIPDSFKRALEEAKRADAVIITAGIVEGEDKDRASLRLTKCQEMLIEEAIKANPKTVVVLFTGSPVVGDWILKAPAILEAWYPGQEGGRALAEVLLGLKSPSGRLPLTWPRHEGQLPLYYDYKPSGRRYDYANMPSTPLFPFGYGLTYTRFEYRGLDVGLRGRSLAVKVKVANVGEREGEEVVQVYVHKRRSKIAGPVKELKGFARVALRPGEEKEVEIEIPLDELAKYDENMRRAVEPGVYEVMVGRSAEDIALVKEVELGEYRPKISAAVSEPRDGRVKVYIRNEGPISDLIPLRIERGGRVEEHRVYVFAGDTRVIKLEVPEGELKVSIDGLAFIVGSRANNAS
jgi:beta-glucosidase